MNLPKVIRADFGSDLPIRDEYNVKEKLIGFLTLVRPIFLFMTPVNAASAAILSIRGFPSWQLMVVGFLTGALAAAGVNIFNRYADVERDKIIWPWRAIPSGRVKAYQALLIVILAYVIALTLCWFFFNPIGFGILLAAIILGSLYSSVLREKVGYLSLPPIEGLIFLCGWACLAPETLSTSIVPWYLYLLGLVWQSGHIMAHYVLHIRYDDRGKPIIRTPALVFKPSPFAASRIVMGFAVLLLLMSAFLPWLTPLSYIYIIPVVAWGLYTIYKCTAFLRASQDKERLHQAWSSLSLFRLIISVFTILSILLYR
jgi:4-hydroxybenzoate polyprenyltransferase